MESNGGKGYALEYGTLLVFIIAFTTSILSAILFESDVESTAEVFLVITILSWIVFFVCVAIIVIKFSAKSTATKTRTQNHSSGRPTRTTYLQPDLRSIWNPPQLQKNVITLKTEISGDENKDKLCLICKLPIRKGQAFSICPYCESVFHKEHLSDWLVIADDCPVCNAKLKEIICK